MQWLRRVHICFFTSALEFVPEPVRVNAETEKIYIHIIKISLSYWKATWPCFGANVSRQDAERLSRRIRMDHKVTLDELGIPRADTSHTNLGKGLQSFSADIRGESWSQKTEE